MLKERHGETHNDVLVKYRSMKQDLAVSNHAKDKLELKVDALSARILNENYERKTQLPLMCCFKSNICYYSQRSIK